MARQPLPMRTARGAGLELGSDQTEHADDQNTDQATTYLDDHSVQVADFPTHPAHPPIHLLAKFAHFIPDLAHPPIQVVEPGVGPGRSHRLHSSTVERKITRVAHVIVTFRLILRFPQKLRSSPPRRSR